MRIGYYAFSSCTGLTSVNIPDSVTEIGNCAFYNCTGLASVNIPDSVTKIGDSAFYNCTGLDSITIPSTVTHIGNRAFSGCTGLTSVIIPGLVTKIDELTFEGCTGLTSVSIPDLVFEIYGNAFKDCVNLSSCKFTDTKGWHYAPVIKRNYSAKEYKISDGIAIDVTDPEIIAKALLNSIDTVFFKKENSPRFVVPASDLSEKSFKVQDKYFKYQSFDPDIEAALWEQAKQLFIREYRVVSSYHDDYGSTTSYYNHCIPITELCSLSESSFRLCEFGDIIVIDKKIIGIIFSSNSKISIKINGINKYTTPLYNSFDCNTNGFVILYADGTTDGRCETEYSESSDRCEHDTTTEYSLTDTYSPDWHNSSWD